MKWCLVWSIFQLYDAKFVRPLPVARVGLSSSADELAVEAASAVSFFPNAARIAAHNRTVELVVPSRAARDLLPLLAIMADVHVVGVLAVIALHLGQTHGLFERRLTVENFVAAAD